MKNYHGCIALMMCSISTPIHAQTNPIAAPFQDFNLIRDEIPQVLVEAQRERYPDTKDWSCEMIRERRDELTKVLGPDEQEQKDFGDRAADAVQKALTNTTTGWIPFRGWIRKLTGAERHAQKVANAWESGIVQRAYLYGVLRFKCSPQAQTTEKTEIPLDFKPQGDQKIDSEGKDQQNLLIEKVVR